MQTYPNSPPTRPKYKMRLAALRDDFWLGLMISPHSLNLSKSNKTQQAERRLKNHGTPGNEQHFPLNRPQILLKKVLKSNDYYLHLSEYLRVSSHHTACEIHTKQKNLNRKS